MSRKYRCMKEYETEIIKMINKGMTLREIGNQIGFTIKEMKNFKYRYNKKQRMIEAGKKLTVEDDRAKRKEICRHQFNDWIN